MDNWTKYINQKELYTFNTIITCIEMSKKKVKKLQNLLQTRQ